MKKDDFLGIFLGNTNRARMLRVFAFSQLESFTTAQAAKRAGITLKAAKKELKALERIGVVKLHKPVYTAHAATKSKRRGKSQIRNGQTWAYSPEFIYAKAISKFVHEVSPMRYDNILHALRRTGRLAAIILSGTFVGDPSRPADIVIAIDSLNESRLERAVKALEPVYGREIRYAAFSTPEFRYRLTIQDRLIRDTLDYPHLVLLDRTRLL